MKKIISLACATSMLLSSSFAFSDVGKEHWGYDAINSMQKRGIVSGFYDNTFKPDDKITKEQLATIVTNAFNLKGNYSYNFEDVSVNRWSNEYIKATWSYFSNVKQGNKYYFDPEKPVTREEAATVMVKVHEFDKEVYEQPYDMSILDQFADKDEIENPYYIALAVEHGIMKGKGGYFAPKDTLTRAEVAAIMYNMLGEESDEVLKYSDFNWLSYMPDNENYMISPFSIKMAMMMVANGADGDTQKEILEAFGIDDINEYNEFSKNLISKYNMNDKVKLNVANSIWLNKDKEFLAEFDEEFKTIIINNFDGTANEVNSSNAVEAINAWCSEKTNGKIPQIIESPDFLAALVNAIYFKGEWAKQFKDFDTVKGDFISYDGITIEKDFMQQVSTFKYFEDEKMQMVEMPYKGYATSMFVAIPKISEEIDFESAIDNMSSERVIIKLPKFRVEFKETLNEILKQMGIEKAFSPLDAEFNDKMIDNVLSNIFVDKVLHKTFIEVDENGTEAAAVTAVTMMTTAFIPSEEPKQFIADKPFIYFIRDNESGAILFMGEIVK